MAYRKSTRSTRSRTSARRSPVRSTRRSSAGRTARKNPARRSAGGRGHTIRLVIEHPGSANTVSRPFLQEPSDNKPKKAQF